MPPPDDAVLRAFLLDYCIKRGYHSAAAGLHADIAENSLPPIASPPIDTPTAFLTDWFALFWDVYSARLSTSLSRRSTDESSFPPPFPPPPGPAFAAAAAAARIRAATPPYHGQLHASQVQPGLLNCNGVFDSMFGPAAPARKLSHAAVTRARQEAPASAPVTSAQPTVPATPKRRGAQSAAPTGATGGDSRRAFEEPVEDDNINGPVRTASTMHAGKKRMGSNARSAAAAPGVGGQRPGGPYAKSANESSPKKRQRTTPPIASSAAMLQYQKQMQQHQQQLQLQNQQQQQRSDAAAALARNPHAHSASLLDVRRETLQAQAQAQQHAMQQMQRQQSQQLQQQQLHQQQQIRTQGHAHPQAYLSQNFGLPPKTPQSQAQQQLSLRQTQARMLQASSGLAQQQRQQKQQQQRQQSYSNMYTNSLTGDPSNTNSNNVPTGMFSTGDAALVQAQDPRAQAASAGIELPKDALPVKWTEQGVICLHNRSLKIYPGGKTLPSPTNQEALQALKASLEAARAKQRLDSSNGMDGGALMRPADVRHVDPKLGQSGVAEQGATHGGAVADVDVGAGIAARGDRAVDGRDGADGRTTPRGVDGRPPQGIDDGRDDGSGRPLAVNTVQTSRYGHVQGARKTGAGVGRRSGGSASVVAEMPSAGVRNGVNSNGMEKASPNTTDEVQSTKSDRQGSVGPQGDQAGAGERKTPSQKSVASGGSGTVERRTGRANGGSTPRRGRGSRGGAVGGRRGRGGQGRASRKSAAPTPPLTPVPSEQSAFPVGDEGDQGRSQWHDMRPGSRLAQNKTAEAVRKGNASGRLNGSTAGLKTQQQTKAVEVNEQQPQNHVRQQQSRQGRESVKLKKQEQIVSFPEDLSQSQGNEPELANVRDSRSRELSAFGEESQQHQFLEMLERNDASAGRTPVVDGTLDHVDKAFTMHQLHMAAPSKGSGAPGITPYAYDMPYLAAVVEDDNEIGDIMMNPMNGSLGLHDPGGFEDDEAVLGVGSISHE